MNIIEVAYSWGKPLEKREVTNYIVLHQRAGWGDVSGIHIHHRDTLGYAGIGYNFYVRLDGSVYRGRPIDVRGAHTENHNWESVGICAEGYYSLPPTGSGIKASQVNYTMPDVQKQAIADLVAYCKKEYPSATVIRHSALCQTSCPGDFYPFDEIVTMATGKSPFEKAIAILQTDGVMISPEYWLQNAQPGGTCKGEFVAGLIMNFAKRIGG